MTNTTEVTQKNASWWSRGPAILIVLLIVGGGGYGVGQWTMSMGWDYAQKLARENGLCPLPSNCGAETNDAISILSDGFSLSPGVTQWCLGVVKWDETHVRKGGLFKSAAVWAMSLPCGAMFGGDSAVKPL